MRLLVLALLLTLARPTFAAPTGTGALLDALTILEEIIGDQTIDEAFDEAAAARESEREPFPYVRGSGAVIDDGTGQFLTIDVEGVAIALRDVPRDAWFAPFVGDCSERGILSGYRDSAGLPRGEFGPADSVTVEQLAKIAITMAGTDLQTCTGALKNTSAAEWSKPFVRCAEKRGLILFSEGTVDLTREALRSEVAVTVLQAANIPLHSRKGGIFTDVDGSTEFASAIETAATLGIISGTKDERGVLTGLFKPADPVNRAEVAKIVSLTLQTK